MTIKRSVWLALLCCGLMAMVPRPADADDPWIRFTGTAVFTPGNGPQMCNLVNVWAYTGLVSTGCSTNSAGTAHSESTTFFNGTAGVTLELGSYSLSLFRCINAGWGDRRIYTGGVGLIKLNGDTVLKTINGRFTTDVNYQTNTMTGSGWATIDATQGDAGLRNELDPNGTGQVEFVFNGSNNVIQGACGFYAFDITIQPTQFQEHIVPQVIVVGEQNFPNANVLLNVAAGFGLGGVNTDLNSLVANQIMTDPGGANPDGIDRISPYCYWELGTVLSSIETDVTFDLSGMPGIENADNLRILQRDRQRCVGDLRRLHQG
ncbi:MAG: hypothetical protein V1800_13735 [Candidatus Latescibacterota bacterium]